jgi:hypothetical protein
LGGGTDLDGGAMIVTVRNRYGTEATCNSPTNAGKYACGFCGNFTIKAQVGDLCGCCSGKVVSVSEKPDPITFPPPNPNWGITGLPFVFKTDHAGSWRNIRSVRITDIRLGPHCDVLCTYLDSDGAELYSERQQCEFLGNW